MSEQRKIEYENFSGVSGTVVVNEFPDTCPACGRGIESKLVTAHSENANSYDGFLQAIFICPRIECRRYFIGIYGGNRQMGLSWLYLRGTSLLLYMEKENFHKIIEDISEKFPIIYNQALTAEENRLDQICGAGYRRALEFLVKDYLIKKHPEKKEEVIKSNLGNAIEEIKDENIHACAKMAVWLGNDEAHYEKKWTDKELTHLKELITLTVNWIVNSETTEKYKNDMQEKKKG